MTDHKLQSLLEICTGRTQLGYSELQAALQTDQRSLEDLVITAVNRSLIVAKMDHQLKVLLITSVCAVDQGNPHEIARKLTQWSNQTTSLLNQIEATITRLNASGSSSAKKPSAGATRAK